ncbi:MAG: LPS assembly lipoprotein LptE [Rhodospirillales bacterium]|nr:LPS assembly lipoprotein LptE [Rhodospirillales bacterium]
MDRPLVGRRALLLLAPLALGACGFHPIYARASNGQAGPAAMGLAQTAVDLIPERPGQLLRLALQERFERNGLSVAHMYDLSATISIASDAIGIQQDTSNTRVRLVATANYQLRAQDPARTVLLSGSARSVDGFNVFDQQLFAADLESEAVQQRMAEAVADEITRQLAVYFDRQAALAAR